MNKYMLGLPAPVGFVVSTLVARYSLFVPVAFTLCSSSVAAIFFVCIHVVACARPHMLTALAATHTRRCATLWFSLLQYLIAWSVRVDLAARACRFDRALSVPGQQAVLAG